MLLAQLRSSFADLKAGKPGRRFGDYYSRKHSDRRRAVRKWALVTAGWALIALGAFFSLVPGVPGIVLAIPGAALVSANSRSCARALDWLELRVRRLLAGKKKAAPKRPR